MPLVSHHISVSQQFWCIWFKWQIHYFISFMHPCSLKILGIMKWRSWSVAWKSRVQPDSTAFIITEAKKPLTAWLQSSQVCNYHCELLISLQVADRGKLMMQYQNQALLSLTVFLPSSCPGNSATLWWHEIFSH